MLLKEPSTQASPARLPVVVQKYGGSSVADVGKLGKVADRIVATRRAGHDVVVVVSAMGKTTDDLLRLAAEVSAAGRSDAEPPRRELDMLVSTGERVAMALLSIAIQARGLKAISFTGSQCGIITNDRHFDARIIEVRPHRIEDELARGCVVIVAGYQGMSYKREITTLGRGGSDTTAVALAAALDAKQCEIYSDVDGVYSADPRVVADATHLPEVDYDTVQEMAESGAKVLCAQAVEWARRANIALYARSTFDAVADAPKQTLIRKFGPRSQPRARAVVADSDVVLGIAAGLDRAERLAEVLQLLTDAGVRLRQVQQQEGVTGLVLSVTNAPQWNSARRQAQRVVPSLSWREDVALISVTGSGLTDDAASVTRFQQLLGEIDGSPRLVNATALRLSAVVDQQQVDRAQRRLHDAFVASE